MKLARRALAVVLLICVSFPAMAVWPFQDGNGNERTWRAMKQ